MGQIVPSWFYIVYNLFSKLLNICRNPLWCSWWAYPPVTRATRVQLPVGELFFLSFSFCNSTCCLCVCVSSPCKQQYHKQQVFLSILHVPYLLLFFFLCLNHSAWPVFFFFLLLFVCLLFCLNPSWFCQTVSKQQFLLPHKPSFCGASSWIDVLICSGNNHDKAKSILQEHDDVIWANSIFSSKRGSFLYFS